MTSNQPSVTLNQTFQHIIENVSFGNVTEQELSTIFRDGRPFAALIERWLPHHYPIDRVQGDQPHDFTDRHEPSIKYDEKTFTERGCSFKPSCMIGTGRVFDKDKFEEHTRGLVFCIVSNVNFPKIFVRFVNGPTLLEQFPNGNISKTRHDDFFGITF